MKISLDPQVPTIEYREETADRWFYAEGKHHYWCTVFEKEGWPKMYIDAVEVKYAKPPLYPVFGSQSSKFDGLPAHPLGCAMPEQLKIVKNFIKMAGRKAGWHRASIEYCLDEDGSLKYIDDTKVIFFGKDKP